METRYPIRAVAKITGLSLDTLRAWERRYRAVVPERSQRRRQYGPEHIDRLLLLSQLVQKGHAIGGIASLGDAELKNLLAKPAKAASVQEKSAIDLIRPILGAVEDFDGTRAGDELNRLAATLAPRDLIFKIVIPLMREIGERWHGGTLAIAQEHLVSEILRNLLGSMIRLFRPLSPKMKMVFATPAGESHEFGILASAMLAAMAGVEPIYLGPDLPALEIAWAASKVAASVVLLGTTIMTERTSQDVKDIAAALPETTELWIGGASSQQIDLARLGRKTVLIESLSAFENECLRWSN